MVAAVLGALMLIVVVWWRGHVIKVDLVVIFVVVVMVGMP